MKSVSYEQFKQLMASPNFLTYLLVRERSALADPYCHSAWKSVCVSATLSSNISETKGARRKVTMGSL